MLPGTLRTGFIPAAVWRNSSKVKLYLGEQTAKVVWQFLLTHDLWRLGDPQLCCTPRQEENLDAGEECHFIS